MNRTALISSLLCLVMLLGLEVGCASTGSAITAAPRSDDISMSHAEGKRLWVRTCGECHALYPAVSRDDLTWDLIMQDMAGEAKLDSEQSDLVLAYLQATNESD